MKKLIETVLSITLFILTLILWITAIYLMLHES